MASSAKPLPLKQRTSSKDPRRDYSTDTWKSVLGLLKPREYLVTVDHFSIWKRHLAWAISDGKDLREYMTQRYASSMVFMSLLLSTELGVLFNSAGVTTDMRHALMGEHALTLSFWTGITIIVSAILTLLSLISTFTAWTMVSAVNPENAHAIFRSSIGQYVAELPGRFIVGSIYSFLIWLIMFFFLLLPIGFWSFFLLLIVMGLFVHTITAFSAFGRIIMHTGAMGNNRIFEETFEASLLPHSLHTNLIRKARANLTNKTSITRQYRSKVKPIHRTFSEDELSTHLSDRSDHDSNRSLLIEHPSPPARKRTESLVKFADGFDTSGQPFETVTSPRRGKKSFKLDSSTPAAAAAEAAEAAPMAKPRGHRPPRPLLVERAFGSSHTKQLDSDNLPFGPECSESGLYEKWLTSSGRVGIDIAHRESFKPSESRDDRIRVESDHAPVPTFAGRSTSLAGSVVSSIESLGELTRAESLTEEEKFDLEYGELLPVDGHSDQHTDRHNNRTNDDDEDEEEHPELHGLLAVDNSLAHRLAYYSSIDLSDDSPQQHIP